MMRLEKVAKDLAAKLRAATPSQQRAASLLACQFALQAASVDMPIVSAAVAELRERGVLSIQRIAELNGLVAQLDEAYFDIQDKSDDKPDLQLKALRLFSEARAVSALSLAGGSDALLAAMEAIYEASVTADDANKIYDAVLSIL